MYKIGDIGILGNSQRLDRCSQSSPMNEHSLGRTSVLGGHQPHRIVCIDHNDGQLTFSQNDSIFNEVIFISQVSYKY